MGKNTDYKNNILIDIRIHRLHFAFRNKACKAGSIIISLLQSDEMTIFLTKT